VSPIEDDTDIVNESVRVGRLISKPFCNIFSQMSKISRVCSIRARLNKT
jgi:hypothetical protein